MNTPRPRKQANQDRPMINLLKSAAKTVKLDKDHKTIDLGEVFVAWNKRTGKVVVIPKNDI
jgi:hypothetical protein